MKCGKWKCQSSSNLALTNQQIRKAENSHPSKSIQIESESRCLLINSVWCNVRLRRWTLLFRCLLLSGFHWWRCHDEFFVLSETIQKREEEKNLRKVRKNYSPKFQCARSHSTSLFVIIVVLKERSNKREHKKYAMNCYCVWKLRRWFGIIKIYSLCFDTRVTSIN